MKFNLEPISVDELISNPGFRVKIEHFACMLGKFPEHMKETIFWKYDQMIEAMKGIELTEYNICEFYFRKKAERADIARSRINFGIQVAERMSVVKNITGIRVIGAESRIEYRDRKRSIRDLDITVDFYSKPNKHDLNSIINVKKEAEAKTNIPIDLLCPGIPLSGLNFEHIGSFDDPLDIRGFPVFWRDGKYLKDLLLRKNSYAEREIPEAMKSLDEMKKSGMYLGCIEAK